jgi:hypothetical protein
MNDSLTEPVWYRQFWPWFLIVLPGSVVVASFITLYIAIVNAPSMVNDNYYKEGLAINRSLHEDKLARQMNLSAEVMFNASNKQITLTLTGDQVPAEPVIILSFIDPVNSKADFNLPLQRTADGSYQQTLLKLDIKRWYLQLSPTANDANQRWRIRGEIDLNNSLASTLTSVQLQ